jgi:serine/threonine-protein kinase
MHAWYTQCLPYVQRYLPKATLIHSDLVGPSERTVEGHRRARPASERGRQRTLATLKTADDVLCANELMRGRLWVTACTGLSIGGIATALVIEGPGRDARLALGIACGVLFVVSAVGLRILADEARYSARRAALYSYTSLATVLPAFHFFGWFSAVVLLVALGGVIFAMGHTTRAVISLLATAVATHATLAGLTIGGVLPDRGVAMLRVEGRFAQVFCVLMCEALIALAFLVGRRLRAQILQGVESYGQAIQDNLRQEALLQEAHDELQRVRKIGDPGRYTGVELGSFKLGVVLGRGAMGEVYEAVHRTSGQPAAVKVMSMQGDVSERAVRRFEREIELATSIQSPHVVRVLEYSTAGRPLMYLAMERLEGNVLADELRSLKRPPQDQMLVMLRHVARGASAAHAVGVIHRDLTPRNIRHHRGGGDDVWKILDFGVTPGYLAPEQAAGQEIDYRSDLFAMACIAYRCLTGQPPYRGASIAEIVYRVVHDMPQRPSNVAAVPRVVDLVLAIALAKAPEQRFASAEEFVGVLDLACHGEIDPVVQRRGEALERSHPWAAGLSAHPTDATARRDKL